MKAQNTAADFIVAKERLPKKTEAPPAFGYSNKRPMSTKPIKIIVAEHGAVMHLESYLDHIDLHVGDIIETESGVFKLTSRQISLDAQMKIPKIVYKAITVK